MSFVAFQSKEASGPNSPDGRDKRITVICLFPGWLFHIAIGLGMSARGEADSHSQFLHEILVKFMIQGVSPPPFFLQRRPWLRQGFRGSDIAL